MSLKDTPVRVLGATCPSCGDVVVTPGDLTARVCITNNGGSYAFHCPLCRMAVSKPAEPRILDLLVATGVPLTVWHMPAELDEPHSGDPIGYDDLFAFHLELERGGWLGALDS